MSTISPKGGIHVHICFVEGCSKNAYFGFTTRLYATIWTCREHRAEGGKHLVPPSGMKRGAAG